MGAFVVQATKGKPPQSRPKEWQEERCRELHQASGDRGAVLRWHRRHFHDRLLAGPVLLEGEHEIAGRN